MNERTETEVIREHAERVRNEMIMMAIDRAERAETAGEMTDAATNWAAADRARASADKAYYEAALVACQTVEATRNAAEAAVARVDEMLTDWAAAVERYRAESIKADADHAAAAAAAETERTAGR